MKYYLLLIIAFIIFSCSEKPRFQLLDPNVTGVDFENTIIETDSLHVMNFEYIYNGGAAGAVDLNNDALADIIFTGNLVPPKIYLNMGNFKFRDITSSFPGIQNGQWYSGISVVDINNDGWNDIYFTCTAFEDADLRKNRLWVNKGIQENNQLLFEEMAEQYGIANDRYGVHSAFFDFDLDGDLDLYILNNFVTERMSASYRKKVLDGSAINNDNLYRNNGDGTFTDCTIEAGIVYEGFGLGLALGDVNKDGYPDLYVSNDYISNDLLYINQGDGTFKNEIAKYLSYQTKSSMGNDMADINNDGNPDIFTLDMMPENYYKKKQTINGFSYIFYQYDQQFGYEHQYLRNMLHMHNGFLNGDMIPYSEVGQMMGIYQTEWSWSPLFADYDNDGDKDLLVSNGFPKDLTDKDWTKYKADVYGFVADEKHVMDRAPAAKTYNYAFENQGRYNFVKKSSEWFEPMQSYSYGAAFADLDNDGDLDYIVNNINDKAFVYKNTSVEKNSKASNYIKIKLIGPEFNKLALGAKVELWAKGKYQFHEHFLSRGYISTVDPIVHFGLSDIQIIDSIKVTWPNGNNISILENISANQVIDVDQKTSLMNKRARKTQNLPKLFEQTDSIIDYTHIQNDFIDFYYKQNLLPHKFSQIGPRMAKGDINGDGLEDIIVGSTNLEPTSVFINRGEFFEKTEIDGISSIKDFSEADLAIVDFDNDGDNDVIAIAGGYESQTEKVFKHYLYSNSDGVFIRIELPISPFSASVVRPFDYDHDGDLDLFIGARIKKDAYPLAADSWILINSDGDYLKQNAMSFNLGMVTDAVWSDYDGDGWEDLMVAREWNSVAVLRNQEGKGLRSEIIPDIDGMRGYWYSITSSDFDNDGDNDYIMGNLGNNHRFHVSDQYPMKVYAIDADMNGILDPIITAYWKDTEGIMTEYPVNYYDELATQIPLIGKKIKNYKSFSFATIDDILDDTMKERIIFEFTMNTTTSYILWNDAGKFRWEALPDEAQVSPIKKTIVKDLNGDNLPDVILAGNDYTFDVSTGYYDANKGLVLMSKDGKPLRDLQTPDQTGLLLQGMVESMLMVGEEDPVLVVGFNRQKVETFSINK
jgi:hypothetical protein